jgi:proteasome accessory factor B
MSPRKSERIMNLTICLLMARRFLDRNHIRENVEGYAGMTDANFERTFERDKDELRSLGVPVETGSNNPLFPDEVGYRIRRQNFELPPIQFTAAETTVLGLASRVWEQATLADRAVGALAKLRAAGVDVDSSRMSALMPSVGAREPSFESFWHATTSARRITFSYRGLARTIEPWIMTYRHGAWYVSGLDTGRGAARMFKLSRVEGVPTLLGKPGAFVIPPDTDLAALVRSLEPAAPNSEAVLAIRGERAPELRRRGTAERAPIELPPGFAAYRVRYNPHSDFVGEVAAQGSDVLAISPSELRHQVIRHLQGWAAATRAGDVA